MEVKVEEKKVDYPPQLKAFQQLWTDLWTIRAAEIRVNACMALIAFKASRAEEMKVTDVESAEKLAKATSDLVEEFEVMKSQKVIEQALRKAGAIKQKGACGNRNTGRRTGGAAQADHLYEPVGRRGGGGGQILQDPARARGHAVKG